MTKLVFLCGCLEPGRDGVGDYSFRLAVELAKQGHSTAIVALNDRYIQSPVEEQRNSEHTDIKILRISSLLPAARRFKIAQEWIDTVNPEWLSLQFVPYAFNLKGMPFGLGDRLKKLTRKRHWHIMFHESWIITDRLTPFIDHVVGFLQKTIIRDVIRKLEPAVIHTSNNYYGQILQQNGIKAQVLQLSSNIPLCTERLHKMQQEFFELGIDQGSRAGWMKLGAFGTLRNNVDLLPAIRAKYLEAAKDSRKFAVLFIGRSGPRQEQILGKLKNELGPGVIIHSFGERDAKDVSAFFQLIDYGISMVPAFLVGKSGAYAAMRFHGLDVLTPGNRDKNSSLEKKKMSPEIKEFTSSDYDPRKVACDFANSLHP